MKIGIIGLGKLGLPLSLVFCRAGFDVYGVDISEERINTIKEHYKKEAKEPKITEYLQKYGNRLVLTTDYSSLSDTSVIIIITQSPSVPDGSFDSTYVEEALKKAHDINENALIVISTTTNLGIIDKLSKIHKRICYNPEMIKQGSIIQDFENPKFVIIGAYTNEIGEKFAEIWKKVHDKPIYFVSPIEAEILKLSLNVSFDLGITFANIIGELCEKYNANSNNVLDVIYLDRRNYKPGLGFMGPCFPRDARNFKRISLENSIESGYLFSNFLTEVNDLTVDRYIKKIKEFNVKNIGILGISYKPNVPYIFESQPIQIIQKLLEESLGTEYIFYVFDPLAQDQGKKILNNNYIHFCSSLDECLEISEVIFIGTANYSHVKTDKPKIDPWN
ncbi:MAG: nucleotide sugar dehydrogenase [Candidatus Thorarchaeota archaeon]